ncbi:MAG: metalloprotease, partial [Chitinophagales bacterium]|nr:metalloprotease [Chitinophagales bacterium]
MRSFIILLSLLCLSATQVDAQSEIRYIINNYISVNSEVLGVNKTDYADWIVTDQYISRHNQVTHVYIRQKFNGIEVFNGIANFNIRNNKVLNMGNGLITDLSSKVNNQVPAINPIQATSLVADYFNLNASEIYITNAINSQEFVLSCDEISQNEIPIKLVYFANSDGSVVLCWDLSIYLLSGEHWYSVRVDAVSGEVIDIIDWVNHCEFGDHDHTVKSASQKQVSKSSTSFSKKAPDSYNVYAPPIESPNHGNRTLEVNPADTAASPFGWHDTNGINGFEFTITRGNNVHASEDANDDNLPGYSPDGSSTLDFNFPLNLNQDPSNYLDPAITNLFYWNNIMHDVWYKYGFDEASGNFQQNNYGKGGMGNDYVNADAQDGSGTNNANFATPPDGNNPRMQMFIWTGGGASNLLHVISPASIEGAYGAVVSSFGPAVGSTPITAKLVAAIDLAPDSLNACDGITNGSGLVGTIALIRRGDCQFTFKVQAAQDEGAIAVIIANNVPGAPFSMGGISSTITIPSVMISQADGNTLYNELFSGSIVNVTLVDSSANFNRDSDLDNGVIAHEYGHGISNRLTGGPSNSGCLSNAEQMGEGWSDFFGMIMTIEAGDSGKDIRGVGTYASGQSTQGDGIRPAPYSTDFAINDFTYASTNNTAAVSQPHGIGFVWCTILWDMTWELIDMYGFDPD